MDPSRTLGRGGGPGESWPLPRALPHLPGTGVQTHKGRTGPGLSPEEASLPLPAPTAPRPRLQKLSTGSNRRLHTEDPEHRSDPRGPIYGQVIFKNTAPLRNWRLADPADRGLTPSYTRVLPGQGGVSAPTTHCLHGSTVQAPSERSCSGHREPAFLTTG